MDGVNDIEMAGQLQDGVNDEELANRLQEVDISDDSIDEAPGMYAYSL